MSKLSLSKLEKIQEAANRCLKPENPNNDVEMINAYDWLETKANPKAIKAMADELINLRKLTDKLRRQRIADRRRFANPAPHELLSLMEKELTK